MVGNQILYSLVARKKLDPITGAIRFSSHAHQSHHRVVVLSEFAITTGYPLSSHLKL